MLKKETQRSEDIGQKPTFFGENIVGRSVERVWALAET